MMRLPAFAGRSASGSVLTVLALAATTTAMNVIAADSQGATLVPSRDAAGIWWVMGAAVVLPGLLAGVNQAMQIWQRLTRKGPLDVAITADPRCAPRTRGDCIEIHEKDRAWIRKVEEKSQNLVAGALAQTEIVRNELHGRLNTLHGSFEAQMRDVNRELGEISAGVKILLGERSL
jgi:hypothetical protein